MTSSIILEPLKQIFCLRIEMGSSLPMKLPPSQLLMMTLYQSLKAPSAADESIPSKNMILDSQFLLEPKSFSAHLRQPSSDVLRSSLTHQPLGDHSKQISSLLGALLISSGSKVYIAGVEPSRQTAPFLLVSISRLKKLIWRVLRQSANNKIHLSIIWLTLNIVLLTASKYPITSNHNNKLQAFPKYPQYYNGCMILIPQIYKMSTHNISKNSQKSNSSRREDKSYLERFRNRSKVGSRVSMASLDSIEAACIEDQVLGRGDRLFQLYSCGESLDNIKIEQEEESQIMRNEYLETELLWFKKIDETKHDIITIKEGCEKETKLIREMEKELTNKKIKLTQIHQKLIKAQKDYQEVEVETFQNQIDAYQSQYDSIKASGEAIIAEATAERNALLQEIQQEDQEINALAEQIISLAEFQSEVYHGKLSQLLDEQQRLKNEIVDIEGQMLQTKKRTKSLQQDKPIPEENHRRYLQLYQKMYMNKQLDIMQELVKNKQKEIERLQDYQKKKALFKLKKSEIEERGKELQTYKKKMQTLQEQIREKSTILLNLYQFEGQKIK